MAKIDFDTNKEWQKRLYEDDLIALVGEWFGLYTDVSAPGANRCFITPEGYIIPTPNGQPHYRIRDWMFARGIVKTDNTGAGVEELENLGCIRVNLDREGYIALSNVKPTYEQYETLEKLFYKYLWKFPTFIVSTTTDNQFQQYRIDSSDIAGCIDYIIKRIKRYYASGTLYESKSKKKKRKALGWWQFSKLDTDAGDVEYNINVFNHLTGADGGVFGGASGEATSGAEGVSECVHKKQPRYLKLKR